MSNNTILKDGSGALFTAESIEIGSGVQRSSTAANLRVANADVASSNPVPVAELSGAPITGASLPSGGAGLTGWLSAIWSKLSGTLATSRTWSLSSGSDSVTTVPSGTQTVSGTVTANVAGGNATAVKVDGSAVTQPVSGSVGITGTATIAETAGTPVTGSSMPTGGIGLTGWLSAIWAKLPALVASLLPVKILLAPGIARALTTTASSADTALTTGIKAISIYARTSDVYFALGNGTQTASTSTHFIDAGERLDFDVTGFAAPHIAVIYGPSAAAATLQLMELS